MHIHVEKGKGKKEEKDRKNERQRKYYLKIPGNHGETQISRYTICLSYTLFPESTLHLNFSRNSHSFIFVPHSITNNVPFSSLKCLYFDNQYIPIFLNKHPATNTDTDRLQTQIEESYILSYWTKVKFL